MKNPKIKLNLRFFTELYFGVLGLLAFLFFKHNNINDWQLFKNLLIFILPLAVVVYVTIKLVAFSVSKSFKFGVFRFGLAIVQFVFMAITLYGASMFLRTKYGFSFNTTFLYLLVVPTSNYIFSKVKSRIDNPTIDAPITLSDKD